MPSIDWNKSDWIIQPRHGPCGLGNKIIFGSMYLHKIDGPTEHFLTQINTPAIPDYMYKVPT